MNIKRKKKEKQIWNKILIQNEAKKKELEKQAELDR